MRADPSVIRGAGLRPTQMLIVAGSLLAAPVTVVLTKIVAEARVAARPVREGGAMMLLDMTRTLRCRTIAHGAFATWL
jgi:hypothetical protein